MTKIMNSKFLTKYFSYLFLLLPLSFLTLGSIPCHAQPPSPELLQNGGLEGGSGPDGRGGGVPFWEPFGQGYDIDRQIYRGGEQSIRCDSVQRNRERGARIVVTLNQTRPVPILVTGWSRADQVEGRQPERL